MSHFGWGLQGGVLIPLLLLTLLAYGAVFSGSNKFPKSVLALLAIFFAFLAKGGASVWECECLRFSICSFFQFISGIIGFPDA